MGQDEPEPTQGDLAVSSGGGGDELVHPVADLRTGTAVEHAWLLGMEAKRRELVLVGARGFEPADTRCRIVVPRAVLTALAA